MGSDSNISISPVEELRWLEYGQRLIRRARNLAASAQQSHTGTRLYALALAGGRQAAGLDAAPQDAALLHLDAAHPVLAGRRPEEVLDTWIFAGNAAAVRDVCVGGGTWCVPGTTCSVRPSHAATGRRWCGCAPEPWRHRYTLTF
ncbi:N-formimino-L-glutamate deiminase [mine drainage metagenome]|uniref:N-formimino-L-glutamate deiminase n=1 Tax=mine drainage metagenome TaxID=410659 RepID=T1B793_9ZZZZ